MATVGVSRQAPPYAYINDPTRQDGPIRSADSPVFKPAFIPPSMANRLLVPTALGVGAIAAGSVAAWVRSSLLSPAPSTQPEDEEKKTEDAKDDKTPTFKRVMQNWNLETLTWDDVETFPDEKKAEEDKPVHVRFTVITRRSEGKKSLCITDFSPPLLQSMLELLPDNEDLHEDDPVISTEEILRVYFPLQQLVKRLSADADKAASTCTVPASSPPSDDQSVPSSAASTDMTLQSPEAPISDQLTDTRLLLKFLDEDCASTTSKLQRILSHNSISYKLLPHIFPRGAEIYYGDCSTDSPQAGIVLGTTFAQGWGDQPPRFEIRIKSVDYAGEGAFVPVKSTLSIRSFDKLRKINTVSSCDRSTVGPLNCHPDHDMGLTLPQLPIVPLKYAPPALKDDLIERGKKFVSLLGGKVLDRPTELIEDDEDASDGARDVEVAASVTLNGKDLKSDFKPQYLHLKDLKSDFKPQYLHYDGALVLPRLKLPATGRAMVDFDNYFRQNPSDSAPTRNYGYGSDNDADEEDMIGGVYYDQLFLCPATVVGFAMAVKRWGRMYVEKFSPIEFDDDAYEGLVMEEDTKDMIKGLVKHGVGSTGGIKDLITGKGVGTIFLLHGNPGMGKTLTAEAVAELLHKPLYSVTVGELGTDASTLEYQLSDVLKIASSWKAVLLLDEADVFLERRNSADVHRNAMVGIFLRLLEYHQGILFLTTNRIASFDPAFASRINVALKYEDLDSTARTTIWKRCLQNAAGKSYSFTDEDITNLAKVALNGRQIRSIVKTAKCIATSQDVDLGMRQVRTVLGVSEKFTKDLEEQNQ
ncbi:hypothetical protein HDU93_007033 [Gonapodya sp. JEL0774]|nr:hypothetical protein HDU93_007033 [Gonapodya sp. JEL0774]